jgi:hypothetical protein
VDRSLEGVVAGVVAELYGGSGAEGFGLEADDVGVVTSVEEESVDGLGDVVVEVAAGIEAAEVGLVVAEAEELDGGLESGGLPRVGVADEGGDGGRRGGDGVCAERQFLNIDTGIAVREWHGEASR